MKQYVPTDWYWIVAGDESRPFSSAARDYIAANNATFLAWKSDGTLPTRIASEAELGEVLADHAIRPTPAGILDGYKDANAARIVAASIFKVLFHHENRLRAAERVLALNGIPADLTAAQAKNALKALM